MTTLTITLKNGLEQQVKQFARESDLSLEEAATELLQRSVDIRKLRELREKGEKYAREAGISEEEDIIEAVKEWRRESQKES